MFSRLDSTIPWSRTAVSGAGGSGAELLDAPAPTPDHLATDYSEAFEWRGTGVPDDDDVVGTSPGAASALWLKRAVRERRRSRRKGALAWLLTATVASVIVLAAAHGLGQVDLLKVATGAGVL